MLKTQLMICALHVGQNLPDLPQFTAGLEKNKIFVKGLSSSITKEELEACFSQHGKLRDVRIVTYRNGTPKGLAYVEYENESSASQAVLKMDGYVLSDHTISVAISNPPTRNVPTTSFSGKEDPQSWFVPSLGGGKKSSTEVRGKARTQLSLVPRSVHHQPIASSSHHKMKQDDIVNKTDDKNEEMCGRGEVIATPAMSNNDFRSMLLKK